jgi:hypothetical protein
MRKLVIITERQSLNRNTGWMVDFSSRGSIFFLTGLASRKVRANTGKAHGSTSQPAAAKGRAQEVFLEPGGNTNNTGKGGLRRLGEPCFNFFGRDAVIRRCASLFRIGFMASPNESASIVLRREGKPK